jgi:cytochrome c oxidase cbb3-type subunit 3
MRWLPVITMVLLLSGCGKPDPAQRYVPPDQVHDFPTLFERNCRGCHGAEGKQGPAPPLHDPLFLAITPDMDLKQIIAEGRKGTLMPAFDKERGGPLTAKQIDVLMHGLRSWGAFDSALATKLAKGDKKPDLDAAAGTFEMSCAQCHGENGSGKAGHGQPSAAW